ncbi:MAG: cyclic pyranopterin monophosphate synthase MoaC [Desulfarculus sp.]|nr:cyclic pyranopterin monophosphate synthase MoaC [Desulfarculus sp.]
MGLSHLDGKGQARMVDVGHKPPTQRQATARGKVLLNPQVLELIAQGGLPKGDALAVARIAGIQAAKRTPELIPLCHPLPISAVSLDLTPQADGVLIEATVKTTAPTGVEMEALTAVSVAALALYDMIKSMQRDAVIEGIWLVAKSGGKSGTYTRK